jgi:hypothetical protein
VAASSSSEDEEGQEREAGLAEELAEHLMVPGRAGADTDAGAVMGKKQLLPGEATHPLRITNAFRRVGLADDIASSHHFQLPFFTLF